VYSRSWRSTSFHATEFTITNGAFPKDLAHHYPGRNKLVVPLGRTSLTHAAREAAKLAQEHDNLWAAYRGEPNKGEREVRSAAMALLTRYGLKPGDQIRVAVDEELEALVDVFREAQIEPDREAHAAGDENVYSHSHPENYLSPIKMEALRQLHGEVRFLASDALELYLSLHDRGADSRFRRDIDLSFSRLYELIGDLPIESYRRGHSNALRDKLLKEGHRTTTVRRRMGAIRTVNWDQTSLENQSFGSRYECVS
jgi:hypothetical protein